MSKKKKEAGDEDVEILASKGRKNDKVIPVKLTKNSRFRFRCHPKVRCFTACCSNVNIALPPYDLLRLRKRLGLAAHEFITQYGEIQVLDKTLFPVVTLKMRDDDKKSCPFVTPQGCTVYEDRPNICRYYPVGMATLRKLDAEGGKDEFYFMTQEDHCKGFEEEKEWTIGEWREDQGADLYDEMNRGWMEILIKKKSHGQGKPFPDIKNEMFFKMSFDTDYFRAFVFNSTFLELYDIPEWLRQAIFAEETLKFKEGALEKRKARADQTMRRVYGQKEKGSIGEIE
jgi:Fe-S-cluster containining protein